MSGAAAVASARRRRANGAPETNATAETSKIIIKDNQNQNRIIK